MQRFLIDLQSVIDAQDHPFVLIDREYRIVAANKAYADSYGIESEQVVGRHCHEVSHHSPVPCHLNGEDCPHQRVFDTNAPCQVLHVHYDMHNHAEHVRILGSPVNGPKGELFLGEAIFRLAKSAELDCEEMKLVGRAPAFLQCVENIARAAQTSTHVLLIGETGVGKTMAACYLHKKSARAPYAFEEIHCPSVTEELFDAELFGNERAAVPGCGARRRGVLERANKGTVFLDEVADLPLSLQGRLLRVLDSGEFRRLGGRDMVRTDIRVVSATRHDLVDRVAKGLFREDLYYRLAGATVTIPPLRERMDDLMGISAMMLRTMRSADEQICVLSPEAIARLASYAFPGNLRELRNILQTAAALTTNGVIRAEHIHPGNGTGTAQPVLTAPRHDDEATGCRRPRLESEQLRLLLDEHDGHRRHVADRLGISERTLYRKIKQYGLSTNGAKAMMAALVTLLSEYEAFLPLVG